MASFQSKVLNIILKHSNIKKTFDKVLDKNIFDKSAASEPPKKIYSKINIEKRLVNGRNVFTLSSKKSVNKIHILYLHGGGYVHGFNKIHWNFLSTLVQSTDSTIIAPDYPLAPEFTYKDSFDMVIPIYKELVATVGHSNVILMGDSSGGGFALALAQRMKKENIDTANQIILLSPWLDIALENPEIKAIIPKDPILSLDKLVKAGKSYAGNTDPSNYLLSPINGDIEGLGKISIFIGTNDILAADSRKFKKSAELNGVNMNYLEYPDMIHTWMFFGLPESKQAIDQIVKLVTYN